MSFDFQTYQDAMKNKKQVNIDELRQEWARRIDDAKQLLDKPSPTAVQRMDAKLLTEEAVEIRDFIAKAEVYDAEYRDVVARSFGATSGSGSGPMFQREDGSYIRSVRHSESVRSAMKLSTSSASLGKLIMGAVTGDWRGADEERAMYAQGTNAAGGFLLTPEMSAVIIDRARAVSVMSAAGCVTLPMETEEMKVVVVASDPTAYWTPEGQLITESEGTFNSVTIRARALACYCEVAIELIKNAPNAQQIIENTIVKSLALGLDEALLNGDDEGEKPQGLLHSPNVTESAVGGAFGYDALLDAMALAWAANSEPNTWIMESSLRSYVSKLKDGEGLPMPLPPEAVGLKKLMSTQLGSADSNGTCYVGDFSNCLIGIRSGIEVEASGVAGDTFKKKRVAIRGLLFADFVVGRANDVIRMSGISGL